tara:strand:+ start:1235 stop:1474 length:240 start_codon:yes stop_codon:yes gene_type:complete
MDKMNETPLSEEQIKGKERTLAVFEEFRKFVSDSGIERLRQENAELRKCLHELRLEKRRQDKTIETLLSALFVASQKIP